MIDAIELSTQAKAANVVPWASVLSGGPTGSHVIADGKKVLFFSSNNYLGLAGDEGIKKALIDATNVYGFGSGASRMVGGTFDKHLELEDRIAKFKGGESAIIFSTGSMTNDTVIPALLDVPKLDPSAYVKNKIFGLFDRGAAVFSDELNHASIVDGCRAAKAEKFIYKHLDYIGLERMLKKSRADKKLIITDSVFSMDGDCVDLNEIIRLKNKYNALLYVDEAHSTGVMGKYGRGISEKFSAPGIDIKMGTFSKAFGGAGGFIVASKGLTDYLRITCRKYIFSTSMPPAQAAGLIKSIDIVEGAVNLRESLDKMGNYLRKCAQEIGFNTLMSTTQIVPILIGDSNKAVLFSEMLRAKDIHVPAIVWPATARGASRLRISIIATHTKADIDYLLKSLEEIGKELKLI